MLLLRLPSETLLSPPAHFFTHPSPPLPSAGFFVAPLSTARVCVPFIAKRDHQVLGSLRGGKGGKVVGVSEEELGKLQDDADRREKQLKQQVRGLLLSSVVADVVSDFLVDAAAGVPRGKGVRAALSFFEEFMLVLMSSL